MINKIIKIGSLLLLILVILTVFPGCQKTDNNTYKAFTFTKGIKFSFEYPSNYYREVVQRYKPWASAGILEFYDKLPSDWYWYDNFNIRVGDSYKSANEAIQEIVNNPLKKQIIEISSVAMAGMQGEMLVYSYHEVMPEINPKGWSCSVPPAPANADTILKIDRIAYFSNSSQLWFG